MINAKYAIATIAFVLCSLISLNAADAETGILELTVIDAGSNLQVPARVRIRDSFGKDHVPADSVPVPIAKDRWFASSGKLSVQVPAGSVSVRIERGTEYRPVIKTIDVAAGKTARHEFKIERWIDMSKRGYSSGENHLHVSAADLPAMLAAEDLDFGTSLSWWNGPKMDISAERGCLRDLESPGGAISCSVCDAEVEHSWGAVYLVGLRAPIEIPSDGQRSNLPFVKIAHEQKALVCYQAGWSREVLIDALLGYVDVVNVCNNNFHRHKYQPRLRYSNLLNVEGFPDYPNTPQGMLDMNFETYYRLLNCGLKLAAGAGSATGAKTTPVGYNRAYVRSGKNPTLPEFIEAWREGKNFVTNGPMLFLRTNDNQKPGDTVALPAKGGKVSLEVTAQSEQPLRSLEVVANGKVIAAAELGPKEHEAKLAASLPVEEGTWIAARCTEEDRLLSDEQLKPYARGGSTPEMPCRIRFAHTSPIYVTVGAKAPFVPSSANQAKAMLKAFEQFAAKTASPDHRNEILQAIPKEIKPSQP